jgi:hypothetical protein
MNDVFIRNGHFCISPLFDPYLPPNDCFTIKWNIRVTDAKAATETALVLELYGQKEAKNILYLFQ